LAAYQELLNESRSHYKAQAEAAKKLLGGEPPAGVEAAEAAAWTATLRIMMNMDEFITRE
jgi:hypothetical protein